MDVLPACLTSESFTLLIRPSGPHRRWNADVSAERPKLSSPPREWNESTATETGIINELERIELNAGLENDRNCKMREKRIQQIYVKTQD
jgi:hypothetical protein